MARLKMETELVSSHATSVFTVKNFSSSVSEEKEEGDKKGQQLDLKVNSNQQKYTVLQCSVLQYTKDDLAH